MRNEVYIIVNLQPEAIANAQMALNEVREITQHPFELSKSVEEIQTIDTVNQILGDRIEELGLARPADIPKDRIRVFTQDVFDILKPDSDTLAHYNPTKDTIHLPRTESTTNFAGSLIHEGLHYHSVKTIKLDKGDIYPKRNGYNMGTKMLGLDEATVSIMTYLLMSEHFTDFSDDTRLSYQDYVPILNGILNGISETSGKDKSDVWKTIQKGLFVPGMHALKDIERTFGKYSLKLLGLLGHEEAFTSTPSELTLLIYGYFTNPDPNARMDILEHVYTNLPVSKRDANPAQ